MAKYADTNQTGQVAWEKRPLEPGAQLTHVNLQGASMAVECSFILVMPLIGVMLGGAIGFLSARRISDRNARATAVAKLRAAFAPALARIEIDIRHGSKHDRPDVTNFMETSMPVHAAAVEEFRAFVSEVRREAYQQSWEKYFRAVQNQQVDAWDPGTTGADQHPWHVVATTINELLDFGN